MVNYQEASAEEEGKVMLLPITTLLTYSFNEIRAELLKTSARLFLSWAIQSNGCV